MAVFRDDLEGKVTVWNPAAERLFGWSAAEMIGQRAAITPPEREGETSDLREKAFAGEITQGFETTRLNRAGERIPVSVSAAPILDEEGNPISTMRVIEDISERMRIEQELKEKSEVLATVT